MDIYIYCIILYIYILHISRVFPTRVYGVIPPLAKNLLTHPTPGTISSSTKG